jgi:hypothetical protein
MAGELPHFKELIRKILLNSPGTVLPDGMIRAAYQPLRELTEFSLTLKAISNEDLRVIDFDSNPALAANRDFIERKRYASITALTVVLKQIAHKGIIPNTTVFNQIIAKLGQAGAYGAAKLAFQYLWNQAIENENTNSTTSFIKADKITFQTMMGIAYEENKFIYAKEIYHYALKHGLADLKMHHQIITLAGNNNDIELSLKIYNDLLDNGHAETMTHTLIIDALVRKKLLKKATEIYEAQQFPDLKVKQIGNVLEVDLHGLHYGTAYLGIMKLLFQTKAETTYCLIPGKGLHSKKSKETSTLKEAIFHIVENYNPKIASLKGVYNNSGRYELTFNPSKLNLRAKPFTPASIAQQSIFSRDNLPEPQSDNADKVPYNIRFISYKP